MVQLDSTERADIPPFGHEIDYMTFGGIYREVSLRVVPAVYLDNIFARPKDVLSGDAVARGGLLSGRASTARGWRCRSRWSCAMGSETLAKGSQRGHAE